MPLSKLAVDKFLRRELRDSSLIKSYSRKKLLRIIEKKYGFKFHTSPRKHQLVCFLLGMRNPGFIFLVDMGGGKTKISLDIFACRRKRGEAKRCLVLVPNTTNITDWMDEVDAHAPSLRVAGVLQSGSEARTATVLNKKNDIVVCTYTGWFQLVSSKEEIYDEDGEVKQRKLKRDAKKAKLLEKQFDMVVFDESSFLRNHQSLTVRCCNRLAKNAYRYALTGTPFDKDPQDFWPQFKMIDGGETLGKTLGLFRAAFFTEKQNYWSGGKVYNFKANMKAQLNRMLRNSSIRYADHEFIDLPKSVFVVKRVVFEDDTWEYYRKLLEELTAARGNFQVIKSKYNQMRQITAGFLNVRDPEGEKLSITFKKNPKLEALVELLRNVPEDSKVVVFCHYIKSGDIICERLAKEKISHFRLFSKSKGKDDLVRKFRESDKSRVLVCSSAGAFGLNLQFANYGIFYESPDSAIVRKQMQKRIHRIGQTKRTYYYDLVVAGSIDEKVLQFIEKGKSLFNALVEGNPAAILKDTKLSKAS